MNELLTGPVGFVCIAGLVIGLLIVLCMRLVKRFFGGPKVGGASGNQSPPVIDPQNVRPRNTAGLTVFKGTLEVLGQHRLLGSNGVFYQTVKVRDGNGIAMTLQNVVVGNDLYNDLHPGVEGVFVFYRSGNRLVMCGLNVGDGNTVGDPNLDAVAKARPLAILVGVLMCLLICMAPFGIYYIILAGPRRPSPEVIAQLLAESSS